jgi:hypothetical protein
MMVELNMLPKPSPLEIFSIHLVSDRKIIKVKAKVGSTLRVWP